MITLNARRTAHIALAALSLAALPIAGCSIGFSQARFKETRTLHIEPLPGSPLAVATNNGSVHIERIDIPDVLITAHIKAQTQERLDATQIIAERDEQGALIVGVYWPDEKRKNNEGCSFNIQLADAHDITVDTSNGAISLAGLSGLAYLDTSNGSITIDNHDGDVRADTSNGRLTFTSVTGDIHADTSNGRIIITDAGGAIIADTSNGAVRIELASNNPGPVDIDTSNGSVSLKVGEAFLGELSARTSNGAIRIENLGYGRVVSSGRNHALLRFGDAEAQRSRVSTSNGSVKLATTHTDLN